MNLPHLSRRILRTLNGETWGAGKSAAETGESVRGSPSRDLPGVEDRGNAIPPQQPLV